MDYKKIKIISLTEWNIYLICDQFEPSYQSFVSVKHIKLCKMPIG